MKRREFITLLGGAAAWPLLARAQQPEKLPTIGFLGSSTPSAMSQWVAAFVQRLRDLGWIEGRTVAIEYRWMQGRSERATEIATEFVRLNVDVIVTYASVAVLAAKQATSVIPIVFAAATDAVGAGLVASLARPGGNVTGLSLQQTDAAGKRLALLREVVPGLRHLAILANVSAPGIGAGNGRGAGSGSCAGPRGHHARNPASRRYRAQLRDAQEPRGGALCLYRPTRNNEPRSHSHLSHGRAATDHLQFPRVRRNGRSDVLWTELGRPMEAHRRDCRQDFARNEACRHPGRAADQVRSRHQPHHRQGARP